MKISNSKKELARIISENGGWRDGAEFSVSTCSGTIAFSRNKPEYTSKYGFTASGGFMGYRIELCSYLKNWHQTILYREEYFHLYPAPDADGWIAHDGKHKPAIAESGITLWCKWSDGLEQNHEANMIDWIDDSEVRVIAYRQHKPEQAEQKFCESVTRSIPEPESKPTIEQLAADYRNRKDYADRKQLEADAAKADAEAKLAELVAAGKAIGFVLSVAEHEPELAITDWWDLLPGDEIEYLGGTSSDFIGSVGVVELIDEDDDFHILFRFGEKGDSSNPEDWMSTRWCSKFRFVRRP